jgi:probable phosphoglycerate mutase
VFVSPQQRAICTAQPLCDAINLPMQIKNGLSEINYGEWEGRTQEDVQLNHGEEYIRWLTEPAWNPPTNGETAIQVTNRALPIITGIESRYKTGNVLVVSHKATIRIIICNLMGIDVGRYRDRIDVPAGSVSVVKFDSHGPMLEILGDSNYMPKYLRERKGT